MMMDALLSCPIWVFYTLSAWATGALILRAYPEFLNDRLLNPAFSLSLGVGLLGTVWSVIALIPHGLQASTVLPILTIPLLFGWKHIYDYIRTFKFKDVIPENTKVRWIAAPLVAFLFLTPVMAWHPLGTDALAFYFAQAKIIAYNHGFVPLPAYESFSQISLPAELTYAAILTLGPELAARMITATIIWSCALSIVALARASGATSVGKWLALLFLLSSTSITLLLSDGKVDLYGAMLGFITLYVFIASPDLSRRYIFLMGLLAGFAVMAKLSYIPILVPMLGFILLWRFLQNRSYGQAITGFIAASMMIGALVLASALTLIMKNYIFYDEPFAPFYLLNKVEDTSLMNQVWFSPEITTWILKTYPLVWTFGQYPMQHGDVSPLLWAALPTLAFVRWHKIDWRNDKALALAIAGILGMLSWAIFYPSTIAPRYIFPALFAFAPLAVRGIEHIWIWLNDKKWQSCAFTALLVLFALVPLYSNIAELKRAVKWVTYGTEKISAYPEWEGLQAGEKELSENGRILLVGWARSPLQEKNLNCLIRYNLRSNNDVNVGDILAGTLKSKQYWEDMYKAGTEVVVVNTGDRKDFIEKIDLKNKPSWLKIEEKKINQYYTLYLLKAGKGAPKIETICAPDEQNIWKPTSTNKNGND